MKSFATADPPRPWSRNRQLRPRSDLLKWSVLLLLIWSCTGVTNLATSQDRSGSGEAWFLVRDPEGDLVKHARIYLVDRDGVSLLATPDSGELLTADLSAITADAEGAILACAEGYYCAGWLLSDPFLQEDRGKRGSSLSIVLSPLRLH